MSSEARVGVVRAGGSGPAVVCRGLGKAYRMYRRPHDRLLEMLGMGVRHTEFWAVRGVDLTIAPGETLGVLGRNGAGKSTLLQLICGTLRATEGSVERSGRVSPLLELGSGFNPEFTGRENVHLCASILGLTTDEVRERFDRIVAFADIGPFLDQPVRVYSSGMRARLAFAVAVHVDASILVLDEILSVGDAAFQRRCFARLREMKDSGVTILFVSHAPGAVVELCDRAVLIDGGERLITGDAKPVAQWYQKLIHATPSAAASVREEIRRADRGEAAGPVGGGGEGARAAPSAERDAGPGLRDGESYLPAMRPKSTVVYNSNGASIERSWLETPGGDPVNVLRRGAVYHWCYEVRFDAACESVRFGMLLKAVNGVELYGVGSSDGFGGVERVGAGTRIRVRFRFRAALSTGSYFLNCGLMGRVAGGHAPESGYLARIIDAAMFRVDSARAPLTAGHVDLGVYEPDDPYGPGLVELVTLEPAEHEVSKA